MEGMASSRSQTLLLTNQKPPMRQVRLVGLMTKPLVQAAGHLRQQG